MRLFAALNHCAHATAFVNATFNLAVFASGAGSNAQVLIDYFKNSALARVRLIVCNKPGAGVLQIAEREGITALLIEREPFFRGDGYVPVLERQAFTGGAGRLFMESTASH
jgi:hypothetical protein